MSRSRAAPAASAWSDAAMRIVRMCSTACRRSGAVVFVLLPAFVSLCVAGQHVSVDDDEKDRAVVCIWGGAHKEGPELLREFGGK